MVSRALVNDRRIVQSVSTAAVSQVVAVELIGTPVVVVIILGVLIQLLVGIVRLVGVHAGTDPVRNRMGCVVHSRRGHAGTLRRVKVLEQVKVQLLRLVIQITILSISGNAHSQHYSCDDERHCKFVEIHPIAPSITDGGVLTQPFRAKHVAEAEPGRSISTSAYFDSLVVSAFVGATCTRIRGTKNQTSTGLATIRKTPVTLPALGL